MVEKNVIYKIIDQKDDDWFMTDGIKLIPRACVQISQDCPDTISYVILKALNEGYINLQVFVKEKDYIWEKCGG